MTPKVCLNMIVKNEAKIIIRLFDSIKDIVDDYVIIDTGSTDNTKEIIKNYWDKYNINGHIIDIPFKNFGYNRTQGLIKAREKSNSDFILLLDADMVIKNINFNKKELIGKEAIHLKQKNRYIEYRNLRLIKKDIPAICVGVTHEYYDTKGAKTENIDSIYIEDIGDGGAKADKFERDIRLLKEALKEEPNNNRYYFYLAQSYKDTGDIDNAIENYKKHITIPGWNEEIWYSHYMISKLYLLKNMPEEAEYWAMKGFSYRPIRAEALYHLCCYFKDRKNYQKAYSYYKLAKSLPFPKDDVLFVEYKVYEFELEFENSVINFYLQNSNRQSGIKSCLEVLNSNIDEDRKNLTLKNMSFYLSPLSNENKFQFKKYSKDHIIFDDIRYNFSSSSVLNFKNQKIANIRAVSYTFTNNPMVFAADKNGLKSTKNLYYNFANNTYSLMKEVIIDHNKHEKVSTHICGIEDIRLYISGDKIKFIGQSSEFKNKNTEIYFNMVNGTYDIDSSELRIEKILESPYSNKVEKNWVHLKDDKFIYSWHPLHIGTLEDKYFAITNLIETPRFFKHFKGSSNGAYYKNMFWFITHYTTDTWNQNGLHRQYKHCLVLLDNNFNLVCYSDPFTIENAEVEFNLGLIIDNNKLIFGYSKNEKDGSYGEIDIDYFIDKFNFIDKGLFFSNIIK